MGTWGLGTFENDDASDWVYELRESKGLDLVRSTLAAATDTIGYLEAPVCANALAAAEVVAALLGRPASDLPESVTNWASTNIKLPARELQTKAVDAVDRILRDSELKELWAETADADNWQSLVRALRARLVP